MNSVGERLKQARTERGMTQAVLAQGLATKGFISLVERDLANCSLPKLRLFADRLGRPLSYFLPEAPSEDIQYLSKTAELALRAGETRQALKAIQEGLQLESTASGSTTTASLSFSTIETTAQGQASSTGNAHVLTRVRRIIAVRAFGRETVVRVEPI